MCLLFFAFLLLRYHHHILFLFQFYNALQEITVFFSFLIYQHQEFFLFRSVRHIIASLLTGFLFYSLLISPKLQGRIQDLVIIFISPVIYDSAKKTPITKPPPPDRLPPGACGGRDPSPKGTFPPVPW